MPYREYQTLLLGAAGVVTVDVQRGYDDERWGERNNPDAERHIAELLTAFRDAGLPAVHVRRDATALDSPLRPGRSGNECKPAAEPDPVEPVLARDTNGAFAGTDLEARLREAGVERPVFVGFATDGSVSTTARTATDRGFEPYVVADATVAFERSFDGTRYAAEQIHRLALAQLAGRFATVVETATLLAALEARA
jgi:nicotinamidase-related amidase